MCQTFQLIQSDYEYGKAFSVHKCWASNIMHRYAYIVKLLVFNGTKNDQFYLVANVFSFERNYLLLLSWFHALLSYVYYMTFITPFKNFGMSMLFHQETVSKHFGSAFYYSMNRNLLKFKEIRKLISNVQILSREAWKALKILIRHSIKIRFSGPIAYRSW